MVNTFFLTVGKYQTTIARAAETHKSCGVPTRNCAKMNCDRCEIEAEILNMVTTRRCEHTRKPRETETKRKIRNTQTCVRTLNVELDHKIGNEKITPASDWNKKTLVEIREVRDGHRRGKVTETHRKATRSSSRREARSTGKV